MAQNPDKRKNGNTPKGPQIIGEPNTDSRTTEEDGLEIIGTKRPGRRRRREEGLSLIGETDSRRAAQNADPSADRTADGRRQGRGRTRQTAETEEAEPTTRSGKKNRQFYLTTYAFLALFGILAAYLIYFYAARSQTILSSPYNTLQDLYAEHVVRGDIVSSDGEVLASTSVAEDGSESRSYPYGEVFAHAVGYFSHGKSGLESSGNYYLLQSHSFFLKRLLQNLKDEKMQGDTLVTTLDASLQQTAYDALGNRDGAVVVLEAKTGRILTMLSKPDYDPEEIGAHWDEIVEDENNSVLLNRATSGLYPPGSVFKILTLLEYVHENKNYDSFRFDCEGSYSAYGETMHCYHDYEHGNENLASAFANSCNGAFGKIGLELNLAKYRKLTEQLLFNRDLPTSLRTKQSSFSLADDAGYGLIMQTAIGQGNTLVTPLHMAMLASAIANGGEVYEPYLMQEILSDTEESVREFHPEKYGSIMTRSDAALLKEYMRGVVTDGTASALDDSAYTAYGKTGSAEYNRSGDSHGWFVGFAEAEGKPDIAIAVIVEDGESGSSSAVPVAEEILDAYVSEP